VSTKNLAGKGGQNASQFKIANPILQVPAGEHTVIASQLNDNINTPVGLRSVTYTFLPGHYYQMATVFHSENLSISEMAKKVIAEMPTKGMDWCFVDITDEVNAGKKDYKEKWESMVKKGEMGKDHVITAFVVTDTSAYAALKPVKAKKVIDESVPYEQSAFLYFNQEFQILQFNDIRYPKMFGKFKGDGKAKGTEAIIIKPLMQIPAGTQTIIAGVNGEGNGRKMTYNFLPGHHYQAVFYYNADMSKGIGSLMLSGLKDAAGGKKIQDWYFIDITYYLQAGVKSFSDIYMYESVTGLNGKDQVREDWYWIEIDLTGEKDVLSVN
jgi:hypothetical protein